MHKLKIGILTLPLKGNYGGVLQAYALLSFLKNNGFDAQLIDRQWDAPKKKSVSYHLQKFVFHNIIRKEVMLFCDKWIVPKTTKIDNQSSMQSLNNQFDAFVVGSDQVWRIEHTGGVKNNYFLDFVTSPVAKKIAYAASFGKDSVDGSSEKLEEISYLLKDFTAISVRENSGVKLCSEKFGVKAIQVLDPVLLANKDIFLKVLDSKEYATRTPNLLTSYVLDDRPDKLEIINTISTQLGLKVNSINYKKDPAELLKKKLVFDFYNYIYPPVENWLRGFRDAEFVVTDSFHGMMFSILFEKQFVVIGNEKRGLTRFTSFLSEFGLLDRLITEENPFTKDLLGSRINYEIVNKKLNSWKKVSSDFILNAINN